MPNGYQELVEKLSPLARNESCLLIASGPSDLTKYIETKKIVFGVMGSPRTIKENNLPRPAATFMDCGLLQQVENLSGSRLEIYEKNILKDIDVGLLVGIQSNTIDKYCSHQHLGCQFNDFILLSMECRKKVVQQISQNNYLERDNWGMVSTGMFAVCALFAAGAKDVTIEGLSITSPKGRLPHSYDQHHVKSQSHQEITREPNNHSMADACCLSTLSILGLKIVTENPELIPLTVNWGLTPPDWAIR